MVSDLRSDAQPLFSVFLWYKSWFVLPVFKWFWESLQVSSTLVSTNGGRVIFEAPLERFTCFHLFVSLEKYKNLWEKGDANIAIHCCCCLFYFGCDFDVKKWSKTVSTSWTNQFRTVVQTVLKTQASLDRFLDSNGSQNLPKIIPKGVPKGGRKYRLSGFLWKSVPGPLEIHFLMNFWRIFEPFGLRVSRKSEQNCPKVVPKGVPKGGRKNRLSGFLWKPVSGPLGISF